jgi:excinuclease ABC subunit C
VQVALFSKAGLYSYLLPDCKMPLSNTFGLQTSTLITIALEGAELSEIAALIPPVPGVYALRHGNRIVHLSWCAHLSRRIARLLSRNDAADTSLGSRMRAAGVILHCWPTSSKLESSLVMYEALRAEGTGNFRKRLRLRLPWFVSLTARDPFPRLSVLNRIPSASEPVFGPFRFRESAQRYADDVAGSFHIRKCTDALVPDASHPGCIYGEMKQCLRPCQQAVSPAEYIAEVKRVHGFLATNGSTDLRALIQARDDAARALQFEEAASFHKAIAKLKEIGKEREDLVEDARSFSGLALTRGSGLRTVRLWPMKNGLWCQSHQITVAEDTTPEALAQTLGPSLTTLQSDEREVEGDIADHLAILVRWYHSSWRDGHWYPLPPGSKLSVRRISRAAFQLLKES